MNRLFIIIVFLIFILSLVYWPHKTIIDIWDNLYCIKTKCYTIQDKDYTTSYCFSRHNETICIVNH